jgi:hypothetical protein
MTIARKLLLVTAAVMGVAVGCGASGHPDQGQGGDGGSPDATGPGNDSGPHSGITCPSPGSYKQSGGKCGTERWDIKTGTDPYTGKVSLVPVETKIATLAALPANGGGASRESPTETTLYVLKDVTLTELKLESDIDYHLVLSDGTATMIAEIPYPTCTTGSPWACFMARARGEIDSMFSVTTSPQNPAATVTVVGVGFFDILHGQTGVAPNAIELHPVLQICFGKGCTPS